MQRGRRGWGEKKVRVHGWVKMLKQEEEWGELKKEEGRSDGSAEERKGLKTSLD